MDKAVKTVKTIKTVITAGIRAMAIGTSYMACGPITKSIIDIINAVIKLIEAEIMPKMVKSLAAVFIVVSLYIICTINLLYNRRTYLSRGGGL